MSGNRIDLLPIEEQLDALYGGQVHSHRVDERVDRQQFVQGTAGVRACDLWSEIDERIAAVGHVERTQRRTVRDDLDVRRRRGLQLREEDLASLLDDAAGERHV